MAESHERMTCQEVTELVTDYLEGALPADEAALFEQHLNFCDGCDWYVDQMRDDDRGGRADRARTTCRPSCATGCCAAFRDGSARDRLQVPASRRHRRLHALRAGRCRTAGRARGSRRPSSRAAAASTPAASSDLPLWLGRELYEIELGGEIVEERMKVVASRARLLRRIDAWDDAARDAYTRMLRRPRARARRGACPTGRRRSSPRPPGGPASIGFITARIAEERDGLGRYHAERARQVAWLAERLGL